LINLSQSDQSESNCFLAFASSISLKKEKEKKREGKVIPATELVVVAAEDMFDKCMEIHNNVGKTGRQGMEVEAKKFYSNISRGIIEIFLKYHSGIKTTPFNAMFGKEAYNGLECLNLPTESREQVKTVKDLYSVLSGIIFYFFSLLY
jgi:hypothetical protein